MRVRHTTRKNNVLFQICMKFTVYSEIVEQWKTCTYLAAYDDAYAQVVPNNLTCSHAQSSEHTSQSARFNTHFPRTT